MNTYWYCGVTVKGIDSVYSYISDNGEIPVGTYVEVPFGKENSPTIGYVKTVGEYPENKTPYPVEKTKRITRIVTVEDYEDAESLLSDYNKDEFDDIDYYIENEDWEEILDWACYSHNSPFEHVIRRLLSVMNFAWSRECPWRHLISEHSIMTADALNGISRKRLNYIR